MTTRKLSVPPVFSRRVTRERERLNWSMRELARRAGMQTNTVIRAENGYDLALSSALALAAALGVSLGALAAEPVCGTCDGTPPAGFTCGECGRPVTPLTTETGE